MTPLFGRSWALDITPPGVEKGARYGTLGNRPSDVHLTFDIERTLGSDANKGKFTLTNLTPDNRNNIVQGSNVILTAGYVGNVGIVFQGFVRKVESAQSGADVVTSLECGDGEPYITYGHLNLSYSEPTTLAQVLLDVSRTLRVELGGQVYKSLGNVVQNLPPVTYPRLVLHGKTKRALDGLLHPLGLVWSIQCGTLLVQNDKGRINLRAIVLSPTTGLVDMPTRTDAGVRARALLNPSLVPGCAVQVVSKNQAVCGNFRVVKASYKGDSDAGDWTVDLEGGALLGPLAPVATTQKTDSFVGAVYEDQQEPDEVAE